MGKEIRMSKVKSVEPAGGLVLVELLSDNEMLGTKLELVGAVQTKECPQAYVLKFGPFFPKDTGIEKGDRVLIQGSYIPVPNFDGGREKAIMEYHAIKAILRE